MSANDVDRQSLRPFLEVLRQSGELLLIVRRVDLVYQLSAFLAELDRGPAVRFEDTGTGIPVVGNLLNSRRRIALGLGVDEHALEASIGAAIDSRVSPTIVPSAPWQEVSIESPDLAVLPVPTFFEHETGPYITAGVIVAKDPESGRRNVSIARLKLLGGNRAFVGIAPNHHLSLLARKAQSLGRLLEIAVTIGNHPAVMLASNLYLPLGWDEYDAAGALLGEPIRLGRCETVDLEVAAGCEIVLEGTLDPHELVDEGEVSEFHGMYERYKRGPVVTFLRLSRRRDALFQVVEPGCHAEHLLIGGVAIGATTGRAVRLAVPSLDRLVVSEGGAGRLHAIAVLRDPQPGDARKVMFAAWASVNLLKTVVVVDADIDPTDPFRVEWAIATRVRPERDLVVVPGVRADRAEPLEAGGLITKVGIDATRTAGDRDDWTIAAPPAAVVEQVRTEVRAMAARPAAAIQNTLR